MSKQMNLYSTMEEVGDDNDEDINRTDDSSYIKYITGIDFSKCRSNGKGG